MIPFRGLDTWKRFLWCRSPLKHRFQYIAQKIFWNWVVHPLLTTYWNPEIDKKATRGRRFRGTIIGNCNRKANRIVIRTRQRGQVFERFTDTAYLIHLECARELWGYSKPFALKARRSAGTSTVGLSTIPNIFRSLLFARRERHRMEQLSDDPHASVNHQVSFE